jgi:uncharacterized membrane protein YjfL (UPF0719 family)
MINDRIVFTRFKIYDEVIRDKNCGVGMIGAANHVAMGLIIYGAISGEGGGLISVFAFWALGQLVLILAAWLYQAIVPYDLHQEMERDNVAVGVAFAGVFLAMGNVVRFGIAGSFISWRQDLVFFATVVVFGLVTLPLVRFATDKIILPGRSLTDELVHQEKPNVGAGAIEACVYLAMSFLIGWCVA